MPTMDASDAEKSGARLSRATGSITSIFGTMGLIVAACLMIWALVDRAAEPAADPMAACLEQLKSGDGPVFALAWSADGRRLAISGFGPIVRVWDTESGEVRSIEGGTEQPRFILGWSEAGDGLILGGLDVPVEAWDLRSARLVEGVGVDRPSDRPGGLGMMSKATRGRAIRIWGASDGRSVLLPASEHLANSVAFAPDGLTVVTGGNDRSVRIWDVQSGRLRHLLSGDSRGVSCVVFSPDGSKVASCGGGALKLWDPASGALTATLGRSSGGSASLAFSPDGGRIAGAGWDGTIRIWDLGTGLEQAKMGGQVGQILAMAWSPDGKTLASGGYDSLVRLWDVTGPWIGSSRED